MKSDTSYPVETWGTEAAGVAAREREAEAVEGEIQAIVKRLNILMLVDDETGTRAARAYEALTSDPFIPTPMWNVAKTLALTTCSVIYESDKAERARFAGPLREVLTLVAEARPTLRRVA